MTRLSCILLIEDDPISRYITMRSIKKHDSFLEIKGCTTGEEALNFLGERSKAETPWPGLIILDITLPQMGGLEFLRRYYDLYKTKNHNTIVWVLTTSSHPQDKEGFYTLGIQEYLHKPLLPEDFNSIYKKHFG